MAMPIIAVLAGLAGLVLGARWFTGAAVAIARNFGVSELVIGLTLVSAGTSLPELTTSILAALRSKDDIAVGNVTGSNIFNVLFILGSVAIVKPLAVGGAMIRFDIPVMAAFSLSVLPLMRTGMRISRLEGGLLLLGYFAYLAMLFS
jgi:cation:H+ antiporter